jgi:hypothetical protein
MSVMIKDQLENLTLSHYERAQNDSSVHVKRVRGVIVNEHDKVVCSSFGYTPEYVVEEDRSSYESMLQSISDCTVYRSEEGTLLRLFFNDGRWMVSTHKRINAFLSRWSSKKSFGELFLEALEYFFVHGDGKGLIEFENQDELFDCFCSTLDTSLVYTFLVRTNQDTKIVCDAPDHPTLFFAGAFKEQKRIKDVTTMIPTPLQLFFSTLSELEEYVSLMNPFLYQGVMVILPDDSTCKILHPQYVSYKNIRGSEPDLTASYMRVRKSDHQLYLFSKMFPSFSQKHVEDQLYHMTRFLHSMYVRRYIKKVYTMIHPVLFSVLRQAHSWHVLDRVQHIVTMEKMMDIIDEHQSLYSIYQHYLSLHIPMY